MFFSCCPLRKNLCGRRGQEAEAPDAASAGLKVRPPALQVLDLDRGKINFELADLLRAREGKG